MKNILWDERLDMISGIGFALVGVAVLALALVSIRQVSRHYEGKTCQPRATALQRESKFVEYNYWSYECLVKTKNDTYIPINKLFNNVQE